MQKYLKNHTLVHYITITQTFHTQDASVNMYKKIFLLTFLSAQITSLVAYNIHAVDYNDIAADLHGCFSDARDSKQKQTEEALEILQQIRTQQQQDLENSQARLAQVTEQAEASKKAAQEAAAVATVINRIVHEDFEAQKAKIEAELQTIAEKIKAENTYQDTSVRKLDDLSRLSFTSAAIFAAGGAVALLANLNGDYVWTTATSSVVSVLGFLINRAAYSDASKIKEEQQDSDQTILYLDTKASSLQDKLEQVNKSLKKYTLVSNT